MSGVYREVVPNRKLVFSWAWQSTPERESQVTIDLKPVNDGTMLTLTHEQFFNEKARDDHGRGWNVALDRLESSRMTSTHRTPRPGAPAGAVRRPARAPAGRRRAGPAGARAHRARLRPHPERSSTPRRMSGRSRRSSADRRARRAAAAGRARRASGRSASAATSRCCMSRCCAPGVPARARCGFGAYFEKGKFVDHWVTEYWNEGRKALGAGRCPARRPPARALQDRLRSARRAARSVPGGRRRLAALPRRQGRPAGLRHPRHVRAVVHRRQRHPRRRRPQQPARCCRGMSGAP